MEKSSVSDNLLQVGLASVSASAIFRLEILLLALVHGVGGCFHLEGFFVVFGTIANAKSALRSY